MKPTKHTIGIIIMMAFFVMNKANADNTLAIANVQTSTNDTAVITVNMVNDSAIVAFQIDIPLSGQLTYIDSSAFLNPGRVSDHSLQAELLAGDTLRIFGYSTTNTPFSGNSGTIVTFKLLCGTVPGNYPLNMYNPVLGDTSSTNIITGHTDGTVTILGPNISLDQTTLNFGRVPLLNSADRSLTINNIGNEDLIIQNITFDTNYFSVVGNTSFIITPGQSHYLTVRFHAVVKGTYNNTMTLISNDFDESSTNVSLSVVAYPVNELHTGNLSVFSGNYAALSFTMNNMEPITGIQFDLSLPGPMTFVPDSMFLSGRKDDHVVSANMISSNTLRVVAYSGENKPFSGDDGLVLQLGFNIEGTGGYYSLNINNVVLGDSNAMNTISASYNGYLQIAAADINTNTTLNYGNVSILDTLTNNLEIYNYGDDTLKITSAQFTNTSFRTGQHFPINILPWQSYNFPVTFGNTTKGTKNGLLKLFSNDPDESPYSVFLYGNAYVPNYISIKDSTYTYGDTIFVDVTADNLEPFTAFQFDLYHTDSLNCLTNLIKLGQRVSNHELHVTKIDSSSIRLIVYSMSETEISGTSGIIATIPFIADSTVHDSIQLSIDSAVMGNVQQQDILWGVHNGVITIKENDVPLNLEVQNIVINNNQSECFNATNIITVAGSGTTVDINSGGEASFIAGNKIMFKPGFHAHFGSEMTAYITLTGDYCTNQQTLPSNPDSVFTIQEIKKDDFINIYPNPTNGWITIDFLKNKVSSSIKVVNFQGNTVLKAKTNEQFIKTLDLRFLPNGMYIIVINTNNKHITKKVIKH